MNEEVTMDHRSDAGACPPEWTFSVYVDRELDPQDVRRVEAHLVRCLACRELVMALEEEAAALRSALSLEEAAVLAPPASAVRPSLFWGTSGAVAASLACLAGLGWLFALPWPSAAGWLNPFDLGGLITMFFDATSMLRDQGRAIYQLAIGTAALLSTAFLLTATFTLATRRFQTRRSVASLGIGLFLWIASADPSRAIELSFDEETVSLPAGEVAEQTWVSTARSVVIDGRLVGDLVAFGDRVVIAGELDGNLLSGARRVEIRGRVTGSVVTFGERVRIGGVVEGNVYSGAGLTTLAESARVGRDLVALGEGLTVSGTVGRDLFAFLEWVEVAGGVGRNVVADVEAADVLATARIGGDLELWHREEPDDIGIEASSSVAGETRVQPTRVDLEGRWDRYASIEFYVFLVVSLAASFLFGMLTFRLAPWVFETRFRTGADLGAPLVAGLLVVFAAPIALVLVALTVVGIPIALSGLASLLLCLYLARIVVGAAVGVALLGEPQGGQWREFALALLAGLAVVYVARALPYLGGVVGFLVLLVGSGAIARRVQERVRA